MNSAFSITGLAINALALQNIIDDYTSICGWELDKKIRLVADDLTKGEIENFQTI